MTQSNSTVAYAAATAAQNEATASMAVYNSLVVQQEANPEDADLLISVETAKAEADKDQKVADELLVKATALDVQEKEATAVAQAAELAVQEEAAKQAVITAAPVFQQPAPIIKKPVAPVVTQTTGSAPAAQSNDFTTYVAKLKLTGTHLERALIAQMETYITKMKPGLIVTPEEGANHQQNLWRLINTTLNNTTSEFNSLFGLLLGYAYAERTGVFHDRYVFRFSEHFTFNQDEVMAFQAILNLINVTCIPGDRKAVLRQVDLRRTLQNFFNEETRQRVIAFYA